MINSKKGNIINSLPSILCVERSVNPNRVTMPRVFHKNSGTTVLYIMDRELRCVDNFALDFARSIAEQANLNLKIVHLFKTFLSDEKQRFYEEELDVLRLDMKLSHLNFEIVYGNSIVPFVKAFSPASVVIDFNPIRDDSELNSLNLNLFEVDAHNILPAKFIADKQIYNAYLFRKKVYENIFEYFTEFNSDFVSNSKSYKVLNEFLNYKIHRYAVDKNNPNENVLSNLSGYINFGFISAQRVALEVYKSETDKINKETFLEELIVQKELAENFCLYNKNFKSIYSAPSWAFRSLLKHKNDFRLQMYSIKDLENGNTDDVVWNAAQKELVHTGKIHGYVRMYWAKKLLYWTESPNDALEYAIYLNDKYAYDAPSPNGYVGILWAIAGLHDRPFSEDFVRGKIRPMSFESIYKKLKNRKYLKNSGIS